MFNRETILKRRAVAQDVADRLFAAEQAIADRASTTKEDSCAGSCAGCDKLCV